MMKSLIKLFLVYVFLLSLLLSLQSCGTSIPLSVMKFTPSNVQLLRVGMPITEVDTLLGKPDKVQTMDFGSNTEMKWEGIVYKYYATPDTQYKFVKRSLTNTLVFTKSTDPPKLNNWTIEFVRKDN